MTNGLSANANKSLIASFAGMAGCFGCIAVAIFVHSKRRQARRELKDKSDDEITAGNNLKTKRLEMNSTTSTRTVTGTGTGNSTRTLTSKTVSVPSTTIYEPIVPADDHDKFGEDDDELQHVTLDVDVPVVPSEQRQRRKKKKKKRKKKRRRMRRKDVTSGQTTKGMDVQEDEEECAVLTGPGCSYRENALQSEFNKLTFDMDQLLKYGVTPDGNDKMMTKGYVRTNKGNIVTKV